MRLGSLCSGVGGLDLAIEQLYGATTVWHAEKDKDAAKVLAAHWDVPNYGDLTTMDWTDPSVEPIDILAAGWPCQPWSLAGVHRGADDERAIWPYVAEAIAILKPKIVALENVASVILKGEINRVQASLEALGYTLDWVVLRASDVGAPHRRDRVFILAQLPDCDIKPAMSRHWLACNPQRDLLPTTVARDHKGDTEGRTDKLAGALHAEVTRGHNDVVWFGKYEGAVQLWEGITDAFPPDPADPSRPGKLQRLNLNPAFSEWLMGWPEGWVSKVDITRTAKLRAIGNGVCTRQALEAFQRLAWQEKP